MTSLSIALKPTSTPVSAEERAARMTEPGFGRIFTDNMVTIRYTEGRGWHDAELVPYGPLTLDPSTMALHYGQEIFEGLKAYRHQDSSIWTFRAEQNAHRFANSARRLAMAELPDQLFLESVEALVTQEREWVPTAVGESLYLRPTMIATEVGLGVRPSNEYLYFLIASVAGAYFPQGVKPVSIWLQTEYVRAAPGGTGEAKCAGNYAASLVAQRLAAKAGCDQVVWLDAVERRYIEEMGGMNLYFVMVDGTLLTPQLTGTLLPGVTRAALLTLGAEMGLKPVEGQIDVTELTDGISSGRVKEVFACGTAAVITPVGAVKSADGIWVPGNGDSGEVTMKLRETLLEIQHGLRPDTHGWMKRIVPA